MKTRRRANNVTAVDKFVRCCGCVLAFGGDVTEVMFIVEAGLCAKINVSPK